MWYADLFAGFWNGLTAWAVLIFHVFNTWEGHEFDNTAKSGNWYNFGFLVCAGSPLMGALAKNAASVNPGG
jgi:hypothetical protein